MKLAQLHADAELLRRHSLPPVAAPRQEAHAVADPLDEIVPSSPERAALFSADDEPWPAPPPPRQDAMPRPSWIARLAELGARTRVRPGDASANAPRCHHAAASPRQANLAPWLAAGVVAIVLLALAAGLLSHRRIDAEAARLVDAKRRVAEQALSLLHPAERPAATVRGADDSASGAAPTVEPVALPLADTSAQARARHDAMLTSIKSGTVLASLPPGALAQPSALPAELPPAVAAPTASPRATSASAAPSTRPAKKVALLVEGASMPAHRSVPPADPLAATTVRGTLKSTPYPQHRVYQLRESDGEWLGFVARADADPLAAGVWAGSGDLLTGGWRVAEVTAQRLTLVGANGALEILRP